MDQAQRESAQEVFDLLVALQAQGAPSQELRNGGICHYLGMKALKPIDWSLLDAAFQAWPKHSGYFTFPVPDPEGGLPIDAFASTPDLWTGDYGDLRRELLDHTIEYLAEVLK